MTFGDLPSAKGVPPLLTTVACISTSPRRRHIDQARLIEPATEAEALCKALIDDGCSVAMLIAPDGLPSLAFRFLTLPPSPSASVIAATIRARFLSELRFRRDLFGWLLVEGDVFQRYAERQPRPVLEVI